MMGLIQRCRKVAAVGLATAAVLAAAGCGDSTPKEGKKETINLTVDIFAQQGFGYDEALYKQYEKSHPSIKIKERGKGLDLSEYNVRLTQWITSGQGAGDIVALEEGTIVQFKAQADKFVNLLDYDAASLKDEFLPWKWEQGMMADGKKLMGLGTDVGGLAMCYRRDLFEKAGLPADRDAVAALWPTWQKYLEVGRRFTARSKSVKFMDSTTNMFNTVLMQAAGNGTGTTYFDRDNKLILATNPDVKAAWDTTVSMIQAGISANLRAFSDGWAAGMKQSQFATVGCPAWMTGIIKNNAGDALTGKWDIAKPPGNGGNWGGSFLAVPTQSKHPKEAAELAKFLTSSVGQIRAFKNLGSLPSNPKALQDPAVKEAKNEYFNNAPTGQIFGATVASFKPLYLGPKNQSVRDEVENALRSVEQGSRSPVEAWQDAIKNGTSAASR